MFDIVWDKQWQHVDGSPYTCHNYSALQCWGWRRWLWTPRPVLLWARKASPLFRVPEVSWSYMTRCTHFFLDRSISQLLYLCHNFFSRHFFHLMTWLPLKVISDPTGNQRALFKSVSRLQYFLHSRFFPLFVERATLSFKHFQNPLVSLESR